ncbi:CapA family protein [Thiohalocapsa marina]|uniref:CapA family protein n=1 Tax=Thiohalocapsa marina TaxID=424902 RepID=UPI0014794F76|nr:CapA family protein [Thiohalocapsa marina]
MILSKPAESVRLFLAGDVMLGRAIDQLFIRHHPDILDKDDYKPAWLYQHLSEAIHGALSRPVAYASIWGPLPELLDAADTDLRLLNLETAITTSDDWAVKPCVFRMHPANMPCLSAIGPDCCTLANNHVLDFGRAGLIETLDLLRHAGIGQAGAGLDIDEVVQPFVRNLPSGPRLVIHAWGARDGGVFPDWQAATDRPGVNYLPDYNADAVDRMIEQVRAFQQPGDITIASLHWGANWVRKIPEEHRRLARTLIDSASVDLIHGHSSHHPIGMEVHRGKLVLYGCGDLINDYEGIVNHRRWRHDLTAAYFVDLDTDSGDLRGLTLRTLQRRQFRLGYPSPDDALWLTTRIGQLSPRSHAGE